MNQLCNVSNSIRQIQTFYKVLVSFTYVPMFSWLPCLSTSHFKHLCSNPLWKSKPYYISNCLWQIHHSTLNHTISYSYREMHNKKPLQEDIPLALQVWFNYAVVRVLNKYTLSILVSMNKEVSPHIHIYIYHYSTAKRIFL